MQSNHKSSGPLTPTCHDSQDIWPSPDRVKALVKDVNLKGLDRAVFVCKVSAVIKVSDGHLCLLAVSISVHGNGD